MVDINENETQFLCPYNFGVNCKVHLLCDYCGWNPTVSESRRVEIRAMRREFLIIEAERQLAKERAKRKLQGTARSPMPENTKIA